MVSFVVGPTWFLNLRFSNAPQLIRMETLIHVASSRHVSFKVSWLKSSSRQLLPAFPEVWAAGVERPKVRKRVKASSCRLSLTCPCRCLQNAFWATQWCVTGQYLPYKQLKRKLEELSTRSGCSLSYHLATSFPVTIIQKSRKLAGQERLKHDYIMFHSKWMQVVRSTFWVWLPACKAWKRIMSASIKSWAPQARISKNDCRQHQTWTEPQLPWTFATCACHYASLWCDGIFFPAAGFVRRSFSGLFFRRRPAQRWDIRSSLPYIIHLPNQKIKFPQKLAPQHRISDNTCFNLTKLSKLSWFCVPLLPGDCHQRDCRAACFLAFDLYRRQQHSRPIGHEQPSQCGFHDHVPTSGSPCFDEEGSGKQLTKRSRNLNHMWLIMITC